MSQTLRLPSAKPSRYAKKSSASTSPSPRQGKAAKNQQAQRARLGNMGPRDLPGKRIRSQDVDQGLDFSGGIQNVVIQHFGVADVGRLEEQVALV